MNAIVIMNPCSGTKKANRYLTDIICIFSSYGYNCRVFMTTAKGDGKKFASRYGKKCDLVVVIGGDGTFNEVVEGLVSAGIDKPIGYIPAGSTNDFGATVGLSKNILRAAEDIMKGTPQRLDIGTFNDRYFTYVASFGAFTRVSYTTPQNVKNALGHLAYVLEGIKDIPTIHHEHMKIETATRVLEDDYIFGAISNSTSVGGILSLDPDIVDLNDGLFEILLVRKPKNAFELNQIILCLNGQVYDCEMINFASTDYVKLHCDNHPDWTLDGEFEQGSVDIEVRNIPNAISVIINKN